MNKKMIPVAAAVLATGIVFSGPAYAVPKDHAKADQMEKVQGNSEILTNETAKAAKEKANENKEKAKQKQGQTQQLKSIDKKLDKIEEKLNHYQAKLAVIEESIDADDESTDDPTNPDSTLPEGETDPSADGTTADENTEDQTDDQATEDSDAEATDESGSMTNGTDSETQPIDSESDEPVSNDETQLDEGAAGETVDAAEAADEAAETAEDEAAGEDSGTGTPEDEVTDEDSDTGTFADDATGEDIDAEADDDATGENSEDGTAEDELTDEEIDQEVESVEEEVNENPGYAGKFHALQNRLNAVTNQLSALAAKGVDSTELQVRYDRVTALNGEIEAVLTTIGKVQEEVMEDLSTDETMLEQEAAEDVSSTKEWNVEFSQQLDPTTVSNLDVVVFDAEQNLVETTINYTDDVKTITITPLQPYKAGETYTLYIGSGISGKTGLGLKNAVKMNFSVQ